MLDADMIEKRSNTITIKDCNPHSVKQFLRYLYMGTVDFNGWSPAVNLLKIAHKYSVQALISLCEAYLITTLVFSNACVLYELSRTYSLKLLKKQSQLFILEAGFIISATDGFFNLKARSLETFLGSSSFNMENEGSVLTCLREWAICECSRRCMTLSRSNVLSAMEPFLKHIRWAVIPEAHRTFIPSMLTEKFTENQPSLRRGFHVPASLQYHINYVKFVVELGAFHVPKCQRENTLCCLRFNVDNHVYMVGFRIVGLFSMNGRFFTDPCNLILSRDDNKTLIQFNLNSLSWTKGTASGKETWNEMIAYLPFPIRLDPFSTYSLTLKCRGNKDMFYTRWPRTRLDSEVISTDLGHIVFRVTGHCYALTQLFILPAPPYRNICNISNSD
ncbi:uncharacterized protein CEXT_675911 [Caerostris extrusa]|uniref:BACK domain-containing protein n=1 Tax=Caerostris extrusa TaxID=172846 RepID=A0AAV4NG45_CAEEX|nr:uncharacterized protein CEXT_675911 [Caerostris extrusa]